MKLVFDNSFAGLPDRFYARQRPELVSAPSTLRVNEPLARRVGLDSHWLRADEGAHFITGNTVPAGADPIALVYAGHQFGNWVPRLGDGRAILMGEVLDADGERLDLQWKGSGRTPFSRGGDGRAPLGPILREFLVSEGMHALGVPTSRVLAAAATGEDVYREARLPGAVLIRAAASHIRIGTFEYFAGRNDVEAVQVLTQYTLERHFPHLEDKSPLALLDAVSARIAELVAAWQHLGFIHGVMNTDNMLLSGETIDFGPCAFMDEYHPATVFSSIDRMGRYAYANQPPIAQWNLARLAQALVLTAGKQEADQQAFVEKAQHVIDTFADRSQAASLRAMGRKIGLSAPRAEDRHLIDDLLALMAETKSDFTLTFRALSEEAGPAAGLLPSSFQLHPAFADWLERWRRRLDEEPGTPQERQQAMAGLNPVFIPRNHRVEAALNAAVDDGDLTLFDELLNTVRAPFLFREDRREYALPAASHERVQATFCGT